MDKLTMRSKIQVRYSTNPRDVGYDDGRGPTDWRTAKPKIMSVRKAADFRRELERRIGQGVYKAISYQHNGVEVSRDDLVSLIADAEYARR